MHTQHVKFSTYVAWGVGVGGVVAVVLVFEEGEVSGMEEAVDDVDGSVLEVVVVVVCGLPLPLFFILLLSSFLVVCPDGLWSVCAPVDRLLGEFLGACSPLA